jgi:Skp family chaperone for outer membrane proteins
MSDFDQNQRNSALDQNGLQGAIARFQQLPKNAQMGIIGLFAVLFLILLSRGGGDSAPPPAVVEREALVTQVDDRPVPQGDGNGPFAPIQANSEQLRRGFVTQQTVALQNLRDDLREEAQRQRTEFEQRTREMQNVQQRLEQTLNTLNEQMRLMEEANARQREEISRLAEEARRQGLRAGAGAGGQQGQVTRRPKQRINQTPLGGVGGVPNVGANQALLQGVLQTTTGQTAGIANQGEVERKPFIPPLGFIKGTLLNGVDAIADGGEATPSLVRLHGIYKTAMNSTVILDGCFMLVEFEGVISTERARGKPARMTCVYPDRGAVTYDVAGYVVDAEDGVEGVPGVFFEGDSGRIALSIAAQFAAGLAGIIAENQQTTVVGADGTAQRFLTGSEARASIASGANSALSDLTDYLRQRAERVSPFIRIDATRRIHVVLLSGTELRSEGDAWTLLFDADKRG